jgi:hypothetical protein
MLEIILLIFSLSEVKSEFNVDTSTSYSIFAEWTVLNYLWDDARTEESFLALREFIPSNNALAGINVDVQGSIYVTVPR